MSLKKVLQVDASRRSGHSNAYFTGLGKQKRVVLFDTLLDQLTAEQLLAVLAHELGHMKKKHIVKRLALMAAVALLCCWLAWVLVGCRITSYNVCYTKLLRTGAISVTPPARCVPIAATTPSTISWPIHATAAGSTPATRVSTAKSSARRVLVVHTSPRARRL